MKLLGGLTLLCYFSHASAACNDNLRRNHCLAETDCVWIRSTDSDTPGRCKNVDKLDCNFGTYNRKLCKKLSSLASDSPCYFDPEYKGCGSTKMTCDWMYSRRSCKALGGGCWWGDEKCQEDSDKDDCSTFNDWRWGCHNKARANCVYNVNNTNCIAYADSECSDYNGSRYRCKNDSRCEWKNNTCNTAGVVSYTNVRSGEGPCLNDTDCYDNDNWGTRCLADDSGNKTCQNPGGSYCPSGDANANDTCISGNCLDYMCGP